MGKYYGSNWGFIKNKVGNAVGRKWNGLHIISQYVPEISNPNTTSQQMVRSRFRTLSKMAKQFKAAVVIGFAPYNKTNHTTGYAAFIKANWEAVSASSPTDISTNFSEMFVSQGDPAPIVLGTVDYGTGTHLSVAVRWTPNLTGTDWLGTDKVVVVVFNRDLGRVMMKDTATISGGSDSILVPEDWNGTNVHVWAFCVRSSSEPNGMPSESMYAGHGEIE